MSWLTKDPLDTPTNAQRSSVQVENWQEREQFHSNRKQWLERPQKPFFVLQGQRPQLSNMDQFQPKACVPQTIRDKLMVVLPSQDEGARTKEQCIRRRMLTLLDLETRLFILDDPEKQNLKSPGHESLVPLDSPKLLREGSTTRQLGRLPTLSTTRSANKKTPLFKQQTDASANRKACMISQDGRRDMESTYSNTPAEQQALVVVNSLFRFVQFCSLPCFHSCLTPLFIALPIKKKFHSC
jgi:hypothetical protein